MLHTTVETTDVWSQSFRRGWIAALSITLLIASVATLTPFMPEGMRRAVMAIFASVCHQLPDRSPHINGVQLAVGHRCLGIYWGLPVAAIIFGVSRGFWPMRGNRGVWVLIAAVLPAGIDWTGNFLGIWVNTPVSRMLTGAIAGIGLGYFFTRAMVEVFRERQKSRYPV